MANSAIEILGIGNAIVDVIAQADDAFLARHGMSKAAMALVDEAQANTLYAAMGPGIEASGGSAANTIAGAASFGARTAFIGKVRDDELGGIFAHDLRALGVRFETPAATHGPSTARCLILVTHDAQRTMNTYLGACTELTPADIDETLVAAADITYLEGYLFDPPLAKEAFRKAATIARGAGRRVALTLSDSFCVHRYRDEFRALIAEHVDILLANEAEIGALYETSDIEAAARDLATQVRLAAITRGPAGSMLLRGDERVDVAAAPIDEVVDTTGAGDLYASGLLFGLARGLPLAECGRLGSLAAREIISHFGARPLLSLAELAEAERQDA
ncbi:MAG TPA: adenosine kinase [Sphingomonadaceae bacterium]|nr:adenosine kinase [Sphingomonadaceae bacterium]